MKTLLLIAALALVGCSDVTAPRAPEKHKRCHVEHHRKPHRNAHHDELHPQSPLRLAGPRRVRGW
jgi:hypothetical protein